jgi:hypothetical protein
MGIRKSISYLVGPHGSDGGIGSRRGFVLVAALALSTWLGTHLIGGWRGCLLVSGVILVII